MMESHRAGAIPGVAFVVGAVAAAWALALALLAAGQGDLIAHDALLDERALPTVGAFLLFLLAWQVITAAMMLPSSLPMVQLFARASRGQERPRQALAAFLAAYFAVWTGFAVAALASDAGLHWIVEQWQWLDQRPRLIGGSVLVAAGLFQFSPLKERCLDACRTPMSFIWRYYGRGVGPAWQLGIRHGLFCLGCCWALMLMMFALGIENLVWMAWLTGIMVIEKTMPAGRRLVPVVGVALVVWGALVLLHPAWLPVWARGA